MNSNHSAKGSVVLTVLPLLLNIEVLWFVTGFPRVLFLAALEKLSAKKGKISKTCSLSGLAAREGLV